MSRFKQGLIILVVFIALISTSYSANSKFKIQQYKPDRYVDLIWTVDGDMTLHGQNEDGEEFDRDSYDIYNYKSVFEQSNSYFNFRSSTNLNYVSESIEQFFNSSVAVYSNLSLNSNNTERDRYDSTLSNYTIYYLNDRKRRDYSFEIRPSVKTGKYIENDFFVSVYLSPSFYYSRTPVDENETTNNRTQLIVDNEALQYRDYIQDYDWRISDRGLDYKRAYLQFDLLPGFGRVYEGMYASTAIYMIDELRDKNVLKREPTEDEMLKLCEIVYQNRNKHGIDTRIRRIEVFDEIFSYLNSINVTDVNGHIANLYIQDIWDYFPNYRRAFGTKFSFGSGIQLTSHSRQYTTDSEESRFIYEYRQTYDGNVTIIDTLTDYDITIYNYSHNSNEDKDVYLTAMVEHYKPLSRKWQLDYTGKFDYSLDKYYIDDNAFAESLSANDGSYYQSRRTSRLERAYSMNYNIKSSLLMLYLVDSRTSLWFRNNIDYRKSTYHQKEFQDNIIDNEYDYNNRELYIRLSASLKYRITIPTELTLSVRGDWRDTKRDDQYFSFDLNNNSYSISAKIRHYLY